MAHQHDGARSWPFVLNAFRHHGLYRPRGVVRKPYEGKFCAQRLSASRIISGYCRQVAGGYALECSTPFGITDYIGYPLLDPHVECVLRCSTPFGITDYIGS